MKFMIALMVLVLALATCQAHYYGGGRRFGRRGGKLGGGYGGGYGGVFGGGYGGGGYGGGGFGGGYGGGMYGGGRRFLGGDDLFEYDYPRSSRGSRDRTYY